MKNITPEELSAQSAAIVKKLRANRYIVQKQLARPIWEIKLPVPHDAISFFLVWNMAGNGWNLIPRPGRTTQSHYQTLLTIIEECTTDVLIS